MLVEGGLLDPKSEFVAEHDAAHPIGSPVTQQKEKVASGDASADNICLAGSSGTRGSARPDRTLYLNLLK